jgi:hypothetical protein
MKIPVPIVAFDFEPLVPDPCGSTLGRGYVARLRRTAPNPRILWETETDAFMVHFARASMRREIARQADELGFDIDAIVRGIKSALSDWSEDQVMSLALEFIFPATLASAQLKPHIEPRKGRGRPAIFDARTFAVSRWMADWQRATGCAPGFGTDSAFPKVIGALAKDLGLQRRRNGDVVAEMRLALKAEHKKLASGRVRYEKVPPFDPSN